MSPASVTSSMRSSPPPEAATSTRCSRCSSRISCSVPTTGPSYRAYRARAGARPSRPTGTHRRSRRRRLGARRRATGRLHVRDRARQGRPDRRPRRPRVPPPARPGGPLGRSSWSPRSTCSPDLRPPPQTALKTYRRCGQAHDPRPYGPGGRMPSNARAMIAGVESDLIRLRGKQPEPNRAKPRRTWRYPASDGATGKTTAIRSGAPSPPMRTTVFTGLGGSGSVRSH